MEKCLTPSSRTRNGGSSGTVGVGASRNVGEGGLAEELLGPAASISCPGRVCQQQETPACDENDERRRKGME